LEEMWKKGEAANGDYQANQRERAREREKGVLSNTLSRNGR
jgi:hypothetical protein